jgi:hypothetical protein
MRDATPEEIAESAARIRAQIEAEQKELALLIRRAHRAVNNGKAAMA